MIGVVKMEPINKWEKKVHYHDLNFELEIYWYPTDLSYLKKDEWTCWEQYSHIP
jgi:hypothetical protein